MAAAAGFGRAWRAAGSAAASSSHGCLGDSHSSAKAVLIVASAMAAHSPPQPVCTSAAPAGGCDGAPATVQSGEHDLLMPPHTPARCSTATRTASHDLSATRAAAQPSDPPAGAAEVHTGCGGLCAAMADAKMSTALAELWLSPRQPCDGDAAADPAARHARPNPAAAAMLRGACSTQMGAPRAHGGSPCRRCSIRVHRWADGQRPVARTRFHPVGFGLS